MSKLENALVANTSLSGKTIAVLATDGFEQVELTTPVKVLKDAGASIVIVAPEAGTIQGFNHHDKGDTTSVDQTLSEADVASFDGLLLPGGVISPDALRIDEKAVAFVRSFGDAGKPIAAICHGPWTLIDAGLVKGKTLTSWPSLKTDLTNAGAQWVDEPVVTDGGLVTSRNPDDLPVFCDAAIKAFGKV